MKKREANFELLRIVAMLQIITLHYLDKGGFLPKPDTGLQGCGMFAWGLEAFCVASVNVYVLISAYFLSESSYQPGKAVRLWTQVFFYSVGIGALCVLLGIVPASQMNLYRVMNYVFPVIEEHYWFVTAYILMISFAPLMNEGLRKIPKKTFQQGIMLLFLLLSVSKSILPVELPTDRLGYDALWFLFLYLTGAYIRYYGKKIGAGAAGLVYFACCVVMYVSMLVLNHIYLSTGKLGRFITRQYQYNSVLCLAASVFMFLVFQNIAVKEGKIHRLICRAASASFGVYLIHEHIEIRYLWPKWLGCKAVATVPVLVVHWFVSILAVYIICMYIDWLRQFIFSLGYLHGKNKK